MIVPITPTIPIEEMMKPKKVRVKVPSADMDYEELQDFLYKQDQMHQKMIEEIDRQQKAAREKADKWVKELWIKGEATAYAPLLDEMNGESGITASGHDLRKSQTYKVL